MKTAEQIFDEWATDARAGTMGQHHWPLVQQGFQLLPQSSGGYLEIGVGSGYAIRHMAMHQHAKGSCLGLDISDRMVALARESTRDLANVRLEKADFYERIFQPTERFSTIFSMEVFYYFPDIQLGIDKAFSLLDGGGRLMIMVDFYEENRVTHGWPAELDTPMQLWSQDQYHRGFQRAGFGEIQQHLLIDNSNPQRDSADLGTLCTVGIRQS